MIPSPDQQNAKPDAQYKWELQSHSLEEKQMT